MIDFQQARGLFDNVNRMDEHDTGVCNNFKFLSSPQRDAAIICDIEDLIQGADENANTEESTNNNNCEELNNE